MNTTVKSEKNKTKSVRNRNLEKSAKHIVNPTPHAEQESSFINSLSDDEIFAKDITPFDVIEEAEYDY